MKATVTLILVMLSITTFAQSKSKQPTQPVPANYYDSAMLKKAAGDHCGYCTFLMKAATTGYSMAGKQYRTDCVKVDTIHYPDDPPTGFRQYSVITEVPCTGNKDQTFYITEPGKNSGYSYSVVGPDGQPLTGRLKEFPARETDQLTFIYIITDDIPEYKGCDEARIKFLQQNIRYPEEAKVNGQQGKVFVTFIVNENGSLSGLKVFRGVSKSIDDEALRVIGMMPPWSPGKVKGKPVKCQFVLPIKFTLQ